VANFSQYCGTSKSSKTWHAIDTTLRPRGKKKQKFFLWGANCCGRTFYRSPWRAALAVAVWKRCDVNENRHVYHTHHTFFLTNLNFYIQPFCQVDRSRGMATSSSGGYRWRLHSPGFRTDLVSLCGLIIVVPQVATPSNVWRARSYIHFEHAETITSEFNLLGRTNGPDIDTLSTSAVAKTVGQDTSRIASYDRSVLARGLFRGHQRRNFPQRKRVHRPGPLSLARSTGHSYSTDNGSWSLL